MCSGRSLFQLSADRDLRTQVSLELGNRHRMTNREIIEAVSFLRREYVRLRGPDPDPVRSCFAKKRYGTQAHADRVVRNRGRQGKALRAYFCEVCGGFHLTSSVLTYGVRS